MDEKKEIVPKRLQRVAKELKHASIIELRILRNTLDVVIERREEEETEKEIIRELSECYIRPGINPDEYFYDPEGILYPDDEFFQIGSKNYGGGRLNRLKREKEIKEREDPEKIKT